jgi:hypothetical protein
MPKIDLTDTERSTIVDLLREYIRTQRYPLAPHLEPAKSVLAKLAPADVIPKSPAGPRRKAKR